MILAVVLGSNGSERDQAVAQHIQAVAAVVTEIIVHGAGIVHRDGGCRRCADEGIIQQYASITAVSIGIQVVGGNGAQTQRGQAVSFIVIKVNILVHCNGHGNSTDGAGPTVVQIPAVGPVVADPGVAQVVESDGAAAENIHALADVIGCNNIAREGHTDSGIAERIIYDYANAILILSIYGVDRDRAQTGDV